MSTSFFLGGGGGGGASAKWSKSSASEPRDSFTRDVQEVLTVAGQICYSRPLHPTILYCSLSLSFPD